MVEIYSASSFGFYCLYFDADEIRVLLTFVAAVVVIASIMAIMAIIAILLSLDSDKNWSCY
jgi:hypothetical protein